MKASLPSAVGRRLRGVLVRWGVRLFAPKWTVGALVVLRDPEGRVLLLEHRGRAKPWGLPGGLLRWPETPSTAAVRECREELGITLREEDLRLVDVLASESLPLLEVVFVHGPTIAPAVIAEARLQASEIHSFRWTAPCEMEGFDGLLVRHARFLARLG